MGLWKQKWLNGSISFAEQPQSRKVFISKLQQLELDDRAYLLDSRAGQSVWVTGGFLETTSRIGCYVWLASHNWVCQAS